jgi:cyclopropane-fatty-acyl-phospholipid synthase
MAGWLDRLIARTILRVVGDPAVSLELHDGERVSANPADEEGNVVVTLEDRRALYELLYKPTRTFGNLFTDGRLSVSTDLVDVLEPLYQSIARREREADSSRRVVKRLFSRPARKNSLKGSKRNISAHYNLGNDFYRLWLDRDYMQYTCAYYPNENVSLEQAQAAKLELVCRKLCLKPGETVVEAGGGWGGLARYLARHYGVKVTSYNISSEQVAFARERAKDEGLEDAVEYVEDDYRNIKGTFDAFVSVGMLEHVGLSQYRRLGSVIDACLKPDGRGFIHTIGQNAPKPLNEWIEANIFPGAYPPTLREMMAIFEPFGFSVLDVENLRPHYALTLRAWRDRFEANRDKVLAMFDERFVRAWYLYLSGSISAFTGGQLQLFQVLFKRPGCTDLPITREHLFTDV